MKSYSEKLRECLHEPVILAWFYMAIILVLLGLFLILSDRILFAGCFIVAVGTVALFILFFEVVPFETPAGSQEELPLSNEIENLMDERTNLKEVAEKLQTEITLLKKALTEKQQLIDLQNQWDKDYDMQISVNTELEKRIAELEVSAMTVNQISAWSMFRPKIDTVSAWEKRKMIKWVKWADVEEVLAGAEK